MGIAGGVFGVCQLWLPGSSDSWSCSDFSLTDPCAKSSQGRGFTRSSFLFARAPVAGACKFCFCSAIATLVALPPPSCVVVVVVVVVRVSSLGKQILKKLILSLL